MEELEEQKAPSAGDSKYSLRPLKPKEAAEFLGISLTTLYEWVSRQILREGRHFIQVGRVKIFESGPELFHDLLEDAKDRKAEERPTRPHGQVQQKRHRRGNNCRAIDRNYIERIARETRPSHSKAER